MTAAPARVARTAASRARVALLALALATLALVACAPGADRVPVIELIASPPWRAGERLEYALKTADGAEVGRGVLATRAEGDRLVLTQTYSEPNPPAGVTPRTDVIAVIVDASTFRPIEGNRETVRREDSGTASTERVSWRYEADGSNTALNGVREREGKSRDEDSLRVRAGGYDNESSLWLWRGFPLAEGYRAQYASVDPIARKQQSVDVRVPQRETIEVPAGRFETWRVLLRSGRAARTAWINITAPHQVVRWDNGDVIFELLKSE